MSCENRRVSGRSDIWYLNVLYSWSVNGHRVSSTLTIEYTSGWWATNGLLGNGSAGLFRAWCSWMWSFSYAFQSIPYSGIFSGSRVSSMGSKLLGSTGWKPRAPSWSILNQRRSVGLREPWLGPLLIDILWLFQEFAQSIISWLSGIRKSAWRSHMWLVKSGFRPAWNSSSSKKAFHLDPRPDVKSNHRRSILILWTLLG